MSTLISAQNLSKTYGAKRALDSVNFTIERGKPVALVGPNGAGKTTLFSILCGYIKSYEGKVEILNHVPGHPALINRVSALPQDAQLDPRFNIVTQLAFYAKLQGFSRKESIQEATRVLELVSLSDVAKHASEDLSHGMRKRVTIAQALIGSPEIVLLDEANAGLDPIHARQIRELVSDLSEQATFILSSHDLSELERLCSQVLHLNNGVLQQHNTLATNKPKKHHFTLMLSEEHEQAISQLQSLIGVEEVYKSQSKEYVIAYNTDTSEREKLDLQILKMCHKQGWHYRQLVNGHTLENQIFAKE